nr:MAG TPA: hypothetical protein [Caudoviricetes sp.]
MDIRSLYHHKMFFNNKNHISFCANRSENCTKRFEKVTTFRFGACNLDRSLSGSLINKKL